MDITECLSCVSLMLSHGIEQIQCFFCKDDTCFNIIINFYNKIIYAKCAKYIPDKNQRIYCKTK